MKVVFLYKKIYDFLMPGKLDHEFLVGIKKAGKKFIRKFFIWVILSLVARYYL